MKRQTFTFLAAIFLGTTALAVDWMQFRGPNSNATSDTKGIPDTWSEKENLVWKTKLPGLGTSSPITVGDAIYLTCYSGYGEDAKAAGDQKDLIRHLVCLERKTGSIRWTKDIKPDLPESEYKGGNDAQHGYAASTPISDGEHLFVFFGKSGVFAFDLKGNQLWKTNVGTKTNGWGSGTSPVLYKNLVIVNASIESGALYALNKKTGKEEWKTNIGGSAWSSPIVVELDGGKAEIVMSLPGNPGKIVGYNPDTGKELWNCPGIPDGYICPSPISHKGIVYAIGGRKNTAVAVKAGGTGKVEPLWTTPAGSNVSSPVYHEGHIYWMHERLNTAYCLNAETGKQVYAERVTGASGTYASGVLSDGKLYYVTRNNTTLVIAAKPKFELISTNKIDDTSRTNASPAIDDGRLLIRTDKTLYCVGKK